MPMKNSKPSSGVTGGQLKTSMKEVAAASPKRATRQGGGLVGGYPIDFGMKSGRSKSGRPSKVKRVRKY